MGGGGGASSERAPSPAWPHSWGAFLQLAQSWGSRAWKRSENPLERFASREGRASSTDATYLNLRNRSSRELRHFVTLTKARPSRPRLFLSLVIGRGGYPIRWPGVASPKFHRKRDRQVTPSLLCSPTLTVMRGAFVVQLGPETRPTEGQFEGWVEEVVLHGAAIPLQRRAAEVSGAAF